MKNKTTRLLGIGLLLFTLLSPLIPAQSASALDSTSTVQTQLYSYESYAFISSVRGQTCADDWAGDIAPNDANDRNWFISTTGQQWRSGQILSPGDGTLSCNNGGDWIDNALDTWGWGGNSGTFLCAVGFTQKPSPSVGLTPGCKSGGTGDGGFHNNGVSPGSTGKAIKDKAYGGKEPVMTAAMRYLLYYRSFVDGCQASQQKVWSAATSEEQNGDNAYRIPFVAPNGTITDYLYAAQKGKGANVTMGANDENGVDELTCGELASRLQNNMSYARAFADAVKANPANAQSLTTSSAANGDSTTNAPVDCGSDALNWIVCPLIKLGLKATNALDGFIMSQLDTNTDAIFGDSNGKNTSQDNVSSGGYYTAWNSFRIIATAIIVIAGLFMVASQAFGFEFLDAYTIRKTLPRLLIAVIGISLSWPLMQFVVNFFNTVGFDIRNLLYAPFDRPGSTISVSTGILTTLGAGAALFIMGPAALTFIITAVLATIVGFLILVIRQIAIIALIVLAPIGIACYVLPNTQKIWKLWSDNFLGLMLMFPIISALIAAGHIFSAVTVQGHTGNSPADIAAQGLALVAYVLPYFLLPMAARLATGVIGTLAGLVNDRGKGVFDRLKKTRQNATATRVNTMRNANRFAGGNATNFRGKLNRGIANTVNAPGAIGATGATLNPGQWAAATRADSQRRSLAEIEQNMKDNSHYAGWMFNDDLNKAASKTSNAKELQDYLVNNGLIDAGDTRGMQDAVNSVEAVRRSMSPEAFRAMTTRQALAGGTAYKSADDGPKTAAGEAWADVARASVNDDALAAYLVANGRSEAAKAGRLDYAGAGFGTTLGSVNRMRDELRRTGRISDETIARETKTIHEDVYNGQGGSALVHSSMKPDSVKEMAPEILEQITTAQAGGDAREFTQTLASVAAVYDGMQGSSPAKAKIMADSVFGTSINVDQLTAGQRQKLQYAIQPDPLQDPRTTITIQQAIDGLRGDNEFKEMRREYTNEIQRQLAQAPPGPGDQPNALG